MNVLSNSTRGGLHPPLLVQTQVDQVTNSHKLLCKSPQEPLLVGGIASASDQNAVKPVATQKSLGFYNRLFLVPKSNNRWRPILDLSTLNTHLNTEPFKMETPETIKTSLQAGEWVTSIDFKDTYFHIPIHSQSKYMRFHVKGRSHQFKALPFGLSTAQMEFTVVAKEVKLFDLKEGKVRPTPEHWQALTDKIQIILSGPVCPFCPVRQFMSLIGLLTATEKQVHLGWYHIRPIQWLLKNNWRVPESPLHH